MYRTRNTGTQTEEKAVSASHILALYDQLKVGMTRAQTEAIVGKSLLRPASNTQDDEGTLVCRYPGAADGTARVALGTGWD